MKRDIVFLPAAQGEAVEAQDWYEQEVAGLGARFRAALDVAVQAVAENPNQFPVVFRDIRRALLRRFPYSIFFRATDSAIFVIACFHSSRDPQAWRDRQS